MGKGHPEDLVQGQKGQGRGMPDFLLFLWAKYASMICKLATDTEAKTACLVRYFAEHILRHWGVFTPTTHKPWIMGTLWFYMTLSQCHSVYGLQNAGPATMRSHRKTQETVRLRDTMLPMDRLLGDECQAMWERIHHKDLCKDHKDLNWLIAHQALPVRARRHRKEHMGRPSCPWPNCHGATETIKHFLWLCTCTKEVWKRVKQLCEAVTSVSQLTREAALYGQLAKHQGNPPSRFDQFASCNRNALWKARNLLLYRQMDVEVVGCVKMALSELWTHYQNW
ncbi:hypothetical protein Y1Q_0004331 [Alligator mississippiensis]|uniref:Uncharacterized protein n=1 Tax=Alligator mississippiensis TaxID=8496 RepID=A0A151MIF5_ALLMI|nr:hypothetical protein Y1Q_0004331 [Alligator mississippiensis]